MHIKLEHVLPGEIEKRSFELIAAELGDRVFPPDQEAVVKRVIHTSADFDYADHLRFSPGAVQAGIDALRIGAIIVTDTNMAKAGINKEAAAKLGCAVECFMGDPEIAQSAQKNGTTRAVACINRAATLGGNVIFAVGNAPTALIRLCELITEGTLRPKLVIGVPVGFVNVVESKELIMDTDVPYIVAQGRKGGSNIAAAICNALLYQATGRLL
ncbi:MAG: precorrin-8X methylmutase [Oscillospiraceae bacterium]|nr:precorrin-8X methylmutase [Oscillospiraceae bacterium]